MRDLIFSLAFLLAAHPLYAAEEQLIACGGAEVFVLSAGESADRPGKKSWSWKAEDSPEIPAELRASFRTTDECKPYDGDRLLITSSSGGVALIRRTDKACLFHTTVKNAHSACLLPGDRLAVASSFGGDQLVIFNLAKSGANISALASLELRGAHGAVWDAKLERLWALGSDELLRIELRTADNQLELRTEERWNLPTEGGHDLSPARDPQWLFVTTESGVYQFDKQSHKFSPFKPLLDLPDVKSVDEHPRTGRIVFHQADGERKTWWSDRIRFVEPAITWQLPGEKLYKVRWDVAR